MSVPSLRPAHPEPPPPPPPPPRAPSPRDAAQPTTAWWGFELVCPRDEFVLA